MDHELAVHTHAVERYTLGEMPSEERDAFEEHYADCKECLSGVHRSVMFAENAHAVFEQREKAREERQAIRETQRETPRRRWLAWLTPQTAIPAFAAIVLAAVTGYQSMIVIPGLRSPHSFGSGLPLDGETRDARLTSLQAGEPLEFLIALNGAPAKGMLEAELIDGSGKVALRGLVKAPGLDQPLDVYFPGSLNSGRYSLVVRSAPSGQPGTELARSPFEIIPQEIK